MRLAFVTAGVSVAVAMILAALYGDSSMSSLKAGGYVEYTPEEAQELAFTKCTQCHSTENITKYCFRCGPPLAVVVHNMRTLAALEKSTGSRDELELLTDAQAIAIAQVWNALIGNWEETWRKQDMVKLLDGDKALIHFLDVPVEDRKIETALSDKTIPGAVKYLKPISPMSPKTQ